MAIDIEKVKENLNCLYVFEYENSNWLSSGRAMLSKLNNGEEFFLIFKSGKKATLPDPRALHTIREMGDHKEIFDGSILNDNDYLIYIAENIKKYAKPDAYICFIQMEEYYKMLKEELEDYAEDVTQVQRYRSIGRRRPKQNKNTAMNTRKAKHKNNGGSQTNATDIFSTMVGDMMDISPEIHTPSSYSAEEKNKDEDVVRYKDFNEKNLEGSAGVVYTQEKKKEEEENPKEDNPKDDKKPNKKEENVAKEDSKKDDEPLDVKKDSTPLDVDKEAKPESEKPKSKGGSTESKKEEDKENKKEKKEERKEESSQKNTNSSPPPQSNTSPFANGGSVRGQKPPPKNGGAGGRQQGRRPMAPQAPAPDRTLQELEDLIFGAETEKVDFSRAYTQWDDTRADTMLMRMEMFKEHLADCTNIPQDDMSDADYSLLIQTLVKSSDFIDFISSWGVKHPSKPLGLEEKNYKGLYLDAIEIMRLSEVLYG